MNRYGLELHALDSYFQMVEVTAPGTPETNNLRLYAKDKSGTSALYYKNDAGTEIDLSGGLTGTGSNGQLTLWTGTLTLAGSARLLYSSGTNPNIQILSGDAAQFAQLSVGRVTSDIRVAAAGATGNWSDIALQSDGVIRADTLNLILTARNASGIIKLATGAADTEKARLTSAGLFGIGTTFATTTVATGLEVRGGLSAGDSDASIRRTAADATSPNLILRKTRGTVGTEAATQASDNIGTIAFQGWGTAFGNGALIRATASELWSGSAQGTILNFHTTADGSTSVTERFRIGQAGQWGIGGATYGGSGDIFSSGGASAAPTWVTRATLNAALDHGLLTGNADDDHTGYALLAGRSGGQTLKGGTASGDDLTLTSTDHATKGTVVISGIPLSTTEQGFRVGTQQDGSAARPAVMMIGESVSSATNNIAALYLTTNFTGAGDGPLGCYAQPTFSPSANISVAYGFLGDPIFSPASGVTITTAMGMFARTIYTGSVGAVTSGRSINVESPVNLSGGSLKPTNQYGLYINNQGLSGISTAIGIHIEAMANATNNYDMSFARVDTTAAGAYYGRVPVLYNGLLKYLHVFSA